PELDIRLRFETADRDCKIVEVAVMQAVGEVEGDQAPVVAAKHVPAAEITVHDTIVLARRSTDQHPVDQCLVFPSRLHVAAWKILPGIGEKVVFEPMKPGEIAAGTVAAGRAVHAA